MVGKLVIILTFDSCIMFSQTRQISSIPIGFRTVRIS
jgi:hypothetical protein